MQTAYINATHLDEDAKYEVFKKNLAVSVHHNKDLMELKNVDLVSLRYIDTLFLY